MKRLTVLALGMVAASSAAGQSISQDTDWAYLGNGPDMQHHASLAQINKRNVARLELAWWAELPTSYGLVGNPLVQDGIVYQGGPGGHIFASDLRSGKLLWSFGAQYDATKADQQSLASLWGRQMNRGLALWKDKAIIATGDCRLVAVDRKTGQQKWEAQSCDATQMYGISGAPRVGDGMVFIGNACMDTGTSRGFVDAFDAETGAHRWRFYTVPGDPAKPQDSPLYDMAAKTWGTDWYSKSKGCGSAWDAMVYDTRLHQLIIGVGGPAPADPSQRAPDAGDELFTNAIVALDGATGQYKWHKSLTPHDGWNYEASVGIMLADVTVNGAPRHSVISVPKGGFAYVLDAATGKFLSGNKYTDITWAKGLDAEGRPIFDPAGAFWNRMGRDTIILPSGMGAHGWEAIALNPRTNVLYIPTMVMPTLQRKDPESKFAGVTFDLYYGDRPDAKVKSHGEVVAFDLVANKVLWRSQSRHPVNGGLLHTDGGLVFQGMADGRLVALDEVTGKILWSRQTGGAIRAAPTTVMVDGQQYLLVATGNGASSSTAALVSRYTSTPQSRTPPRLLAFRLGGRSRYPALDKFIPVSAPATPRQDVGLAAKGGELFEGYGCSLCHGGDGGASVGGVVPNLNRMPPASLAMFRAVVQKGALVGNGMPHFKEMSDGDASAIFAYIINEAWRAHEGSKSSGKKARGL